ncbi:epsin-2-like [Limulus polyphemus]|uniref:Epsin-2-like n=1 Tax=Limulus polyphemus TaxID=6850 RepID=A0ABM1BHW1_LIMPO|nr:epsin-2-like [Limulus polyphemus]
MNVHGLRRNVKNVVCNYSDAQVKVRKATSNDPWGPSSTLMSEISNLTYNIGAFSEIMLMIWKRLNDHGKNWRHVYKALVLLDYLIKTGSEKVAQQCRENIFAIQTLKDFQYIEENKDQGINVREKSKQLVTLLRDEERLKSERVRALKARERFAQSISHVDHETGGMHESSRRDAYGSPDGAASPKVQSELEGARPQSPGEEEIQLQLALAMSKEAAEQEERQRQNDDLRLQLAITESRDNSTMQSSSSSNNRQGMQQKQIGADDLFRLKMDDPWSSSTVTSEPTLPRQEVTDPWGLPVSSSSSFSIQMSPSHNVSSTAQDPWSSVSSSTLDTNTDPWSSLPPTKSHLSNDPWNTLPTTQDDQASAWTHLTKSNNEELDEFHGLRDPLSHGEACLMSPSPNVFEMSEIKESLPSNAQRIKEPKSVENFLGANSSLVNLDNLISTKSCKLVPGAGTNPFSTTVYNNPFQLVKPQPPSINQLRAQNQFQAFPTHLQSNDLVGSEAFQTPLDPTCQFTDYPQNPFM